MLDALFRNAVHGLVELAWTTPAPGTKAGAKLANAQLFALDDDSIDSLIKFACELSARPNTNVYIGVALRVEDADKRRRHGAADILSIPALKVDCDAPSCLERALGICNELGMRPNKVIFTGHIPHKRGALYWRLDQPSLREDFVRIETVERRLAKLLGSDPSVVDAPRVMRLAGGVAWPLKKGRTLEMTGVYETPERVEDYTLDELEHVTRDARSRTRPHENAQHTNTTEAVASAPESAPGGGLDFNDARPQADLTGVYELLRAAMPPGEFHEHALPLVMSLTARGTPADVITELVGANIREAGVNVEQRLDELRDMVRGAVRKVQAERGPVEPDGVERPEFRLIPLRELIAPRPPELQRIKGVMPLTGLGVLFGASQSFKSFIVNDIALRLATGLDWCGRKVAPCPVVNIVLEGFGAYPKRIRAWVTIKGDQLTAEQLAAARYAVMPDAVNFLDAPSVQRLAGLLASLDPKPGLIIVDTLARAFGGSGDESMARDMGNFIRSCQTLERACGAFVLVVHHSGKDPTKGARGSSALGGAEDTRYRLTRVGEGMITDMLIEKLKDGPGEGTKFRFNLNRVPVGVDEDGEEETSLVPVFDGSTAATGKRAKLGPAEQRIMIELARGALSYGEIIARTGIAQPNVTRTLKSLTAKACVHQDGYLYRSLLVDEAELEDELEVELGVDDDGSEDHDDAPEVRQ